MSWTRPAGISDSRQKRAKTAPRAKKGAEKRCRKKVPVPKKGAGADKFGAALVPFRSRSTEAYRPRHHSAIGPGTIRHPALSRARPVALRPVQALTAFRDPRRSFQILFHVQLELDHAFEKLARRVAREVFAHELFRKQPRDIP